MDEVSGAAAELGGDSQPFSFFQDNNWNAVKEFIQNEGGGGNGGKLEGHD